MDLSSLPSLQEAIKTYGLSTKKSLGQNFITDTVLLDRIAHTAGNIKNHSVIEVGPGPGGLTRALLLAGAHKVIAIEQDHRCIEVLLPLKHVVDDKLELIEGNALTINEKKLLNKQPTKIVANLPYNVATELLFKWLNTPNQFESMHLMFQKEVAERIIATPGTKNYGWLSILSQWSCQVKKEFDIGPESFIPSPKVMSTFISLYPRKKPLFPAKRDRLEMLCKVAFNQRRKMLRKSLKQLVPSPETLLKQCNIDPTLRPEDLSIDQFCLLSDSIAGKVNDAS